MNKADHAEAKQNEKVEQYRLKKEKEKRKRRTISKGLRSNAFFTDKSRAIAVSTGAEDIKKENESNQCKKGKSFKVGSMTVDVDYIFFSKT